MNNKKIILAGGSGFLGQALIRYLGPLNEVVILSRTSAAGDSKATLDNSTVGKKGLPVRWVHWDGQHLSDNWMGELEGADLIINLAGQSVNCRYHRRQKEAIINSRVIATHLIGQAIRQLSHPPEVWINASTATIYRDSRERHNDETTGSISPWRRDNMPWNAVDCLRYSKNRIMTRWQFGKDSPQYRNLELDFSVGVAKAWEDAFFHSATPQTRKAAMRIAITLGRGGVMIPFVNLCKWGLGGKQGSGNQRFSWVHEKDVARMIEWIYTNEQASGIYNCAAPEVVMNKDWMRALRQAVGRPFGLPAPSAILELAAWLYGTETELLLKSRWVLPARALNEGFVFQYPGLETALHDLLGKKAG